jgi:hypothetical protein
MRFIGLLIGILIGTYAQAQVASLHFFDRYYTTFNRARVITNPAYAGFESQGNLHLFTQQYFYSYDPAPSHQQFVLGYDGRLAESKKHNLGGIMFFDRFVYEDFRSSMRADLQIPYAFRIHLSDRKKISFGVAPYLSYVRHEVDTSPLTIGKRITDAFYLGATLGGWLQFNGFYAGLSGWLHLPVSNPDGEKKGIAYDYTFLQFGYKIPYESVSITPLVHTRIRNVTDQAKMNFDMGFLAGFLDDKLQAGYAHAVVSEGTEESYWGAFTLGGQFFDRLNVFVNYRIPRTTDKGSFPSVLELSLGLRFGEIDQADKN